MTYILNEIRMSKIHNANIYKIYRCIHVINIRVYIGVNGDQNNIFDMLAHDVSEVDCSLVFR
jgi:hypothetical protein